MKTFKKILLGFLLSVIIVDYADARWLTMADAPLKSSYLKEINIRVDGTYEVIGEIKKEILSEIGRSSRSNIIIKYNGDSTKIDLLDAKTVCGGKEYKLDRKLIEDKPLASSYDGFDQFRQIFLAFPKADIGSILYVKYKLILKKPNLENFFAETFYFGADEIEINSHIKIKSQLPLYTLVNDPTHLLRVTKEISDNNYTIDIVLTKPLYNSVIGEPNPTIINHKYFTWISISSLNNWENFAIKHGKQWEEIFAQELPKEFVEIAGAAQKKSNDVDKINTVTSLLNDKIKYMGDWRTVKGRFVPRSLEEISKRQIGDCKDFSAATAAILTKLGFKAQIAVVMRGMGNLSKPILPSFEAFNHAIVKVTNKKGRVYWIDPTNFESMADNIFPDIANKMAMVLDPTEPSYEKTPMVDYKKALMDLKREWFLFDGGKVMEKGSFLTKNAASLGVIGAALKVSDVVIKDEIFRYLAKKEVERKNQKYMILPKLNSREVGDIYLRYGFELENYVWSSNLGPALKFTYMDSISKICNVFQDNMSDILISDLPSINRRQTIIKSVEVENIGILNKEIKTPWIAVKRECKINEKHDLQVDDVIVIYKNLIPKEDLKTPQFLYLKKWLEKNFQNIVIVVKPT